MNKNDKLKKDSDSKRWHCRKLSLISYSWAPRESAVEPSHYQLLILLCYKYYVDLLASTRLQATH